MEFLILLGILLFLRFTILAPETQKDFDEVVPVKQCPPHKWQYKEIKDTSGNTVKWKIVCDVCGPMVTDDRPRNTEY